MYDCGGFLSIVNAQDEGIKDNHPNGILIKMMRGPFSHQVLGSTSAPSALAPATKAGQQVSDALWLSFVKRWVSPVFT